MRRMVRTRAAGRSRLLGFAMVGLAVATPAAGQQTAPWVGAIRCDIQAQAPGYLHQETQTWTLTGAPPTVQGSVTVYPATWSVTAQGSHDRTRNTSRRIAQWSAAVPGPNSPVSAPIGFTLHAVGNQFDVAKWHAQLTVGGGYTGTDQFVNAGVPAGTNRLVTTVYEWQFPKIEAPTTQTQLSGSHTSSTRAFVGPLQPEDAQVTITCTWALGRGSAPPLPPSTVPPPPSSPTSSNPATNPPATAGGGTSSSPGGSGAPVNSPPASGASASGNAGAPSAPTGSTAGGGVAGGAVAGSPAPGTAPSGGTPAGQQAVSPAPPQTAASSPTNSLGAFLPPGGFTPVPTGAGPVTTATAQDPSSFSARQTADGTVLLTWTAVPGAGAYLLGGPGTNVGITVSGTSHTVTGIPQGNHTWTVATMYDPGGIRTTAANWTKAMATVVNRAGRYRIVVNGFRVNRPTFDDRVFGNGDEVYASAALSVLDRRNDSALLPRSVIGSDTYGDVSRNPERIRAGSFSPTGGLWGGDTVPPGTDPRSPSGAPSARRFPWTVWEGTLQDGVEAVVVNPVLWEVDGQLKYYDVWADGNSFTRQQPARAAAQAAAIKDRATRGDLTPFRGMLVFICSSNSDLLPDCEPGNDRPIGINRESCVGDTFASNLLGWCDVTIVFTREGIEKALSSTTQVGGAAASVIAVPLVEPSGVDPIKGGMEGSYELYISAERLP